MCCLWGQWSIMIIWQLIWMRAQSGSCGTQISAHPQIWERIYGETEQNSQAGLPFSFTHSFSPWQTVSAGPLPQHTCRDTEMKTKTWRCQNTCVENPGVRFWTCFLKSLQIWDIFFHTYLHHGQWLKSNKVEDGYSYSLQMAGPFE